MKNRKHFTIMLGLEITVEDHTLTVSREFCLFYRYKIRNIIQISILDKLLCLVIKTVHFCSLLVII